ncbi:nuclear transport factor 2 family protein [Brevundimonas subvibrioides]|uniref:SnoaL-like domain-containing protein n=1 Tax=Brevundimonas subvibrioides (strain ATCC 15264 / DSM 4735 / LMG 14903 / NBRC 16000 / CB 81) TaxID=633149 RepID=D9QIN2_BRESC|nr:nuclear transport factor 2 family protein [Brevundimonas subvibrioides]ADL01365.1 conserved hypothetical protein [Brevundimonas subvibrioides ATCC 15264]
MGRVAAQVERVESVRAIKRLQHAWAHYAQIGLWDDIAALFAADGVFVRGELRITGPSAIRDHLRQTVGEVAQGRLLVDLVMSPVVTLSADGRSGKGRWHELTIDAVAGERADWAGGIQENDYVLEEGAWKIASLHAFPQFAGPYLDGWRNVVDPPQAVEYHFSPASAGRPATDLPDNWPVPDTADVAQDVSVRIVRLEDEAAIVRLQNSWGYYVDRRQWDDVADLFAEDGRLVLAGGDVVGPDAIRQRLEAVHPAGLRHGELNDHLLFAPVVTVDHGGQTASARGIVLGMLGLNHVEAHWTVATCENSYVKQDGVWRLAAARLYPRAAADYVLGWAGSQVTDHPTWALAAASGDVCHPVAAFPEIQFEHPVRGGRPSFPPATTVLAVSSVDARSVREAPDPTPTTDGLERRLAATAAVDAVENIATAYGYYIDEFRWAEVRDLFSTHGWKELSYIGTYVGRDRVYQSLIHRYGDKGRVSSFLAIHQKIQPVITVAADAGSARMHLRLFQVGSLPTGPGPFIGGVYEDEAVLEDGVWKLSGMDLDYIWFSGYRDGWGRVDPAAARQFAPGPDVLADYPPDRPLRGPVFSPFPDAEPLPFHFRNPVSGREPPLLLE